MQYHKIQYYSPTSKCAQALNDLHLRRQDSSSTVEMRNSFHDSNLGPAVALLNMVGAPPECTQLKLNIAQNNPVCDAFKLSDGMDKRCPDFTPEQCYLDKCSAKTSLRQAVCSIISLFGGGVFIWNCYDNIYIIIIIILCTILVLIIVMYAVCKRLC